MLNKTKLKIRNKAKIRKRDLKNSKQKCLFLVGKNSFLSKQRKKKNKENKAKQNRTNQNKGGFRAKGIRHLTRKPSPINKNKNKSKNVKSKNKNTKKNKRKKQEKKQEKTKHTPQNKLSVISHVFLFWGVPKIPFFDNFAQKARAPRNTIKLGFQQTNFWKKYASRNGHFWTKKTQIQKFQLSFSTKTQTFAETPTFIVF